MTTALHEALNDAISSGRFIDTKIMLFSRKDTRGRVCTVKIVLLHGVCSSKILCIYTIMQLRRTLLLVTHCDLLRGVTDNPVLQGCLSRVLNSLPFDLTLH